MGHKPIVIDPADHAGHEYGRSDAFQSRCMEIMQSLGLPIEQLEHMGKKLYGRTFWEISPSSESEPAKETRTAFARFYPEFLDFDKDYSLAVRQGLIEQVLIHDIENHCDGFRVQWGWGFVSMELPKTGSEDEYSRVCVQNVETGEEKVLKTRYVVACDGARSSVRRWASQFGVQLEGASLPVTWCVLDAVGLRSDHPDLEKLCIVRSPKGIVLVIPREPINGKPAARFDIQIEKSKEETKEADAARMIKEIFAPYTVEWDEVNWWSIYDVGQRIINKYSIENKVFFVGDACHTHSPRAGLGLNTALLEAHNLSWKLSLVLQGIAKPSVLQTYADERHGVAKELIDMDRQLVGLYAGLEQQNVDDFAGKGTKEWLKKLQMFQAANYAYQAGASVVYAPNMLTSSQISDTPKMVIGKPGVAIGSRTRPAVVTRLSDSVPVPILPQFDGRFTIYVLIGDCASKGQLEKLKAVDEYVRSSDGSIFGRYGSNVVVEDKSVAKRMPLLRIPRYTTSESESCQSLSSSSKAESAFPQGRKLYSYNYDDIPQITAAYHAPLHSLFRVNIIVSNPVGESAVQDELLPMLYPQKGTTTPATRSHILKPANVYCDDIPVVSPYRQTAPESGLVFEHPMHMKWGVDVGVEGAAAAVGAIIVARPDGHVGVRTAGFGVEAWKEVEAYFGGILA
ncbi:hypothetical protein BT96DRAFT_959459 [Gymnopus androsaceus JB14]|uniref:FAD-binding domain-containing protein n=1 Tax=Gymnopus androsaceus JB14 TaxID=1447944 RepID=A0A6A4H3Z9_9AGAR|nr:hypothetical protein BT96DRAFT_959459 [Gymnopus androsaceus JB14]